MTFRSLSRAAALAIPALLLLAACGSSTPSSAAATRTPSPTATPSPSSAGGAALTAALTVADVSASGGFTQKSDGLLGGLANTDARVFANADGTIVVEVDLVADTGASGATSDYPPYQSAAANQVKTQASTSTPGLGQKSNEYVGTDSSGKNAISISFIEGRYIAVVTTLASSTLSSDVVKTTAEFVAKAQDDKINSLGS